MSQPLGVALPHEQDVVVGPGPTFDELEAFEPVHRSDPARLPFELDRGAQRPATADAQQLKSPALLESQRLEELDLLVLLEEAGRDDPEEGEVVGAELEGDRLHRSRAEPGFRYEPMSAARLV